MYAYWKLIADIEYLKHIWPKSESKLNDNWEKAGEICHCSGWELRLKIQKTLMLTAADSMRTDEWELITKVSEGSAEAIGSYGYWIDQMFIMIQNLNKCALTF